MNVDEIRFRLLQIADEAILDPDALDPDAHLSDLVARVREGLLQAWNETDEHFDAFMVEVEQLEELIDHPAAK